MATSIIRCHPFSGTNENEPPCYLLQVDDVHILLDCGWDSKFSDNYVLQIAKYIKIIGAVFISHPDVRHMGALPYLVGKCGLNCPVYMTSPVNKMGHLALYDAYLSICNSEDFTKFNLDDIDAAFSLSVNMKYQQTLNLLGKGQGVKVTPYAAGHMIGGAIWKIVKDDLEIVYAMDFNHKKENHLNGAIFSDIQRPHLLITSSYHALQKVNKKHKEDRLKQILQDTLRKNGNVLFLSDTAGRSLELSYLLDKMWRNQESGLMAYRLAYVNTMATNVIEFAKSFVEWLSDDLTHGFESTGWKPFHFKYTTLCHDLEDIKCVTEPMVVVVSQSHLNHGLGRELFSKWCENERNVVIMTARDREHCLSSELFKHAQAVPGRPEMFIVTMKEESRSTNEDVIMKLTRESLNQAEQQSTNMSNNENAMELDDDLLSGDEDSIKEECEDGMPHKDRSYFPQDDSGISSEGSGFHLSGFDMYPNQHSHSGGQWFRATKRLSLVFPSTERKVLWDEYGEHIDVKDPKFLNTAGSSYAMDAINQKLMWDGMHGMESEGGTRKLYERSAVMGINNMVRDRLMGSYDSGKECYAKMSSQRDLTVKCSVLFHDYEGLADAAAVQQMVMQCRPQEIIIVGGSPQASADLAHFCRVSVHMNAAAVHVPKPGQLINCTKEGHIFQARLSDALVSSLSFQKVGKYELAWVDAVMRVPSLGGGAGTVALTAGGGDNDANLVEAVASIPVLELPAGPVPDHKTIFINEPRLADLKQLLAKRGMNAEIKGGVLVVDNCVTIRKNEAGKLLLEGTFSDTYFEVRQVLYSQFAIL